MTTTRRRLLGAIVLLTASACSSTGDDTTDDAPETTLETAATATDPATTDSAPTGTASTDTAAPTPEVTSSTAAPTSTLVPSPDADLPTDAPSTDTPVTTIAGPLPVPAVSLIDLASFNRPVEVGTRPGDSRLYVVEQGGSIIAADDESLVPVFDIGSVEGATFTNAGNEQGLLGLAFSPSGDLAYIHFNDGDGGTVLAELNVDPDTGTLDPASYRVVLTEPQPFANHNGGEVVFGPDGLLYIGLGDGGAADDPNLVALDLSSRLGKILRIDPTPSGDQPFTVPPDNPFAATAGADPLIWTFGLRNPWRFSFDSLTGDLWIADVGQNRWEEIDLAPAVDGRDAGRGLSFGWSAFEAEERFNESQDPDGHTLPVASYLHENGNCSVSGGVVARESTYPDLNGWYIYGDFCSGKVWALDTTSVASSPQGPVGDPIIVEIATVPGLAAVVEGPFGDIYTVSNAGPVQRLAPA